MMLNKLGTQLNNKTLQNLTLDSFLNQTLCDLGRTSETNAYHCLSSRVYKTCFQHSSKVSNCVRCNHQEFCTSKLFNTLAEVYSQFHTGTIRFPRFKMIEGKMTYVPIHKRASELTINEALVEAEKILNSSALHLHLVNREQGSAKNRMIFFSNLFY